MVLIVEDSPMTNPILLHTFKKAGMAAVAASTVLEGLAALARAVPDVVVTDLRFPHESGFTLCKQIRTKPEYRDVKVIAISALSADEVKTERGWFEGAYDRFFAKPFPMKDLVAAVESMLPREARGANENPAGRVE
jgi:two-component system phosphate regulon response regulator PhoB